MRRPDVDEDWLDIRRLWSLRSDTLYLNHGSFGPPPDEVLEARRKWQAAMDCQPMDFFVRQLEPAWRKAREALATFVGTQPENLTFAENATAAMNVVASNFRLQAGDEVLLTDHEYGAVRRIWERRCDATRASMRFAALPKRFTSNEEVVDAIVREFRDTTRLLIVSHITSPTAITLPVTEICRAARAHDVHVCIDGPHAIAQIPLVIDELQCDYYAASCHKWLSAPFGSGFLYVAPQHQADIQPPYLSWGRLPPAPRPRWSDEFLWSGTRDSSAYLSIPAAIEFLQSRVGLEAFRARGHYLAQYARQRLVELTRLEPLVLDSHQWYSCMAHVPLPPGDAPALQKALWELHGIEVPIVEFQEQRYIRVSCHAYTLQADIDRLITALRKTLQQ